MMFSDITSSSPSTSSPADSYPYILFYDWLITPSNPYSLAIYSQWFASLPFTDPSPPPDFPAPPAARQGDPDPSAEYKTAEHWMMYHKSLLFDPSVSASILAAETPDIAKKLGREIKNFNRELWNDYADKIVERGNYLKFRQHPQALKELLGTKGKIMVEASPDDRIWGIGFSRDEAKGNEARWGLNRMGLALTRARDRLLEEHDRSGGGGE